MYHYKEIVIIKVLLVFAVLSGANAYFYSDTYACTICNLTKLPTQLRYTIRNMNLSMNRIENAIFTNYNLHMIDLSYNPIKTLKISNIYDLQIYLQGTMMDTIKPNTFSRTTVSVLDLSHNNIENLEDIFTNTPHTFLAKFIIDYNKINSLNASTLTKFHGNQLSLSNNLIDDIAANTFNRTNIAYLDLSHNNITYLKEDAFKGSTIRRLILKNNNLKELHKKSLNGIVIERLDLSNNILEMLQPSTFSSLQRLLQLDLSFNKFQVLNGIYFSGLLSLKIINLSNNNLKEFNEHDLFQLLHMERLYVNDNNYTKMNVYKLIHLKKNLTFFSFKNNFLDCQTVYDICYNLTMNGIAYDTGTDFNTTNFHGIPCLKYKVPLRSDTTFDEFVQLTQQEVSDIDEEIKEHGTNDTLSSNKIVLKENEPKTVELLKDSRSSEEILLEMHVTMKFVAAALGIISICLILGMCYFIWQKYKLITKFNYESFAANDVQL